MKLAKIFMGLSVATIGTLFVSCSTLGTTSKNAGAIACPDCRVVVETDSNIEDYSNTPTPFLRHECPGCQGSLTSVLKGGKLQHSCSVCKDSPYSCNVTQADVPDNDDSGGIAKKDASFHTHVFKQS